MFCSGKWSKASLTDFSIESHYRAEIGSSALPEVIVHISSHHTTWSNIIDHPLHHGSMLHVIIIPSWIVIDNANSLWKISELMLDCFKPIAVFWDYIEITDIFLWWLFALQQVWFLQIVSVLVLLVGCKYVRGRLGGIFKLAYWGWA